MAFKVISRHQVKIKKCLSNLLKFSAISEIEVQINFKITLTIVAKDVWIINTFITLSLLVATSY